jgi:hypothetical protein
MSEILADKLSYDELNAELIEAKNKIKELEKRVKFLDEMFSEKISIESNLELHSAYVENWKDCDRNEFSGSIYWTKNSGILYNIDRTRFEGEWDYDGEIMEGELTDCAGNVIEKWENGEEILESDEDESDENESKEDESDEDESEEDESDEAMSQNDLALADNAN